MQIIVRGRRGGKTTELFRWLLRGHGQKSYPHWSRVIVCGHRDLVPWTAAALRDHIKETGWDACAHSAPHLPETCETEHLRTLTDVINSVWGVRDLQNNLRGRPFEYVVDDADGLALGAGAIAWWDREPVAVTMTGTSVTSIEE